MRYLALLPVLLLAACGTSSPVLDGGTDAAPSEAGADVLGSDVPTADTQPPGDAQQPDVGADVAPEASSGCVDNDHDGYGAGCAPGPDCNDGDPSVHPGAMERCDGVDSNCDGIADTDGSPALNAYCASTAPTPPNPPGIWNDVMPTCRYPGDPMTAAPVTAVACEAGYFDSRDVPHFTCWRVAGATVPCPMP
jgi:hypothetical protein